jgi:hypothetical protein
MHDDPSSQTAPGSAGPHKPNPIRLAGKACRSSGLCDAPGESADEPTRPGALMIGRPGWNSGPMPDLTAADLSAAVGHRGWQVSDHGDHVSAEFRAGSMLRVLASRTPAELAARIADAEAGMPSPDPTSVLVEVAGRHPTWSVDAEPGRHGVTATHGDVHLWAADAAELGALLDVADPMMTP